MNPLDELRGDYDRFLKSPAGKDLLTRIVAYETQLQTENYRDTTTTERKLTNTDKLCALYWVRTLLADLSKPKSTPAKAGKRSSRP